jgi:hypothetical protein
MKTEISDGIITLKQDSLEFAEKLFEAADKSRVPEFTSWMPWLTEDFGLSNLQDFLEKRVSA